MIHAEIEIFLVENSIQVNIKRNDNIKDLLELGEKCLDLLFPSGNILRYLAWWPPTGKASSIRVPVPLDHCHVCLRGRSNVDDPRLFREIRWHQLQVVREDHRHEKTNAF